MFEVFFASYRKRDPTRVWDPAVLFSETFRQEHIANGARKRNVYGSASMDVAYFRCLEAKLPASKTVRVSRYARPDSSCSNLSRYFISETLFNASFDACA